MTYETYDAQRVEKLMRRDLANNRKEKEVKAVVLKDVHKGPKDRPKGDMVKKR